MSTISTHVLDTTLGKPAMGISVLLEENSQDGWKVAGQGTTDADGRCRNLCNDTGAGTFRLIFTLEEYFSHQNRHSIYPEVTITFRVDGTGHYHIPLLLSDNGYTTYRGS